MTILNLDLDTLDPNAIPSELILEKIIKTYRKVPLFIQEQTVHVATDDLTNQEGLADIQFHTGLSAQLVLVENSKLSLFIKKLLDKKAMQRLHDSFQINPLNSETQHTNELQPTDDDAPIVQFINRIILEAIQQGASDIHFEPYFSEYRIRYRKDGILATIATPPLTLAKRMAARLKVIAHLDLAEKRLPQDGHFTMQLSTNHRIDCRISTCPTIAGETIVVRILDTHSNKPCLDSLGLDCTQKNIVFHAINRSQGLILVTGPTGSGKTLTLYAALKELNSTEKNISTVEDPVEIKLPGVNQVNINPKIDLSFSKILRAFLRQDPDVIMIGEIRDLETAEIAIKASQTGHLVLSTLHTNNAAETLTRLVTMGLLTTNLSNSLSLIIAQRLARRLCVHCKQPDDNAYFNEQPIYKATGCAHCHRGYDGQIGLFETMPISAQLSTLIMADKPAYDIQQQAIDEGMTTIYESGLNAVRKGITSLDEVNRVAR